MRTQAVRSGVEKAVSRTPAFPWRYELAFPSSRMRYTYIPKNGCSTLKLSLGRHEGWLSEGDDPHAISARNRLRGQILTRHTEVRFVVLRDPLQRLASAFLDRFSKPIDHATDSLVDQGLLRAGQQLGDVTFSQFVEFLREVPPSRMDPHWRPQVDFMHGEYTHYFHFERFDRCLAMLEQRRIPLRQHRPHATSRFRPLGAFAGDLPARELQSLRQDQAIAPRPDELARSDIAASVRQLYMRDYALMETIEYE